MSFRRFGFAFMALFAFFCSGFVSESYINKAIANAQNSSVEEAAKAKVKEIYPELKQIIKAGANKTALIKFAEENICTSVFSKRLCGARNSELENDIKEFLVWRFSTEAIRQITDFSLDSTQARVKKNIVEVKSKLNKKSELNKKSSDSLDIVVFFSKDGEKLEGILELFISNVPLLFEPTKTIIKKYCETNNIKLDKMIPEERAKICSKALKAFMKKNKREG